MNRSRSKVVAFAGLVIAVVVLVIAMVGGGGLSAPSSAPPSAVPTAGQTTTPEPAPASTAASVVANPSTLPTINASQLPKEGRETLTLIAKGGPYPYREDDGNFGNFESLLPKKSNGFYKEYTVVTPGKSSRGERRIVVGKDSAKYYTPDHYESFKFIVEGK